jgi:hypothetical protein
MDGTINKGIAIVLAMIFLPIALLVFGQLGTGQYGFWYGVNNPNTTGQNCFASGCFANGTISGAVSLLEATIVPILVTIGVAVAVLLGAMRMVKGK